MTKFDYDAVVIGGGSAGLTASGLAANFGAKTMMIEAARLGGDCTWTGCVPSKTLLKAGKVAHHIRNAGRYGLIDTKSDPDPARIMQFVRSKREQVYEKADKPEIYEDMGVEVIQGMAEFSDVHSVRIEQEDGGNRNITARYFFICTGGRAAVPPIQGLEETPFLTNESLFEAEALPKQLLILGGGNIGIEMAQAFNRLGSEVTIVERDGRILAHDDPELAGMMLEILEAEGIGFLLSSEVKNVSYQNSCFTATVESDGEQASVSGDALLVAAGRKPNLDGLGLDAAGVQYDEGGISVNERCRTNIKHIYACGDVTGEYQFTHMSEHMAKIAVTNALIKFPMKIDRSGVPWSTYTDPELAHVGATEQQLQDQGTRYEVYRFPYHKIDRAVTESEENGLIKIYAKKWNGKILGADVLGERAGELISEYAVAMKNGVSLRKIADTIHPYPSYGLGARRAADQWYIKNQSEWSVRLIQKVFGYRGEVPDYSDTERIV